MLLGNWVQHHRLCGLGFLSLSYAETEIRLEAFSAEILPNAGFRVFDESLKENWWMSCRMTRLSSSSSLRRSTWPPPQQQRSWSAGPRALVPPPPVYPSRLFCWAAHRAPRSPPVRHRCTCVHRWWDRRYKKHSHWHVYASMHVRINTSAHSL